MTLLVAGTRDLGTYEFVEEKILEFLKEEGFSNVKDNTDITIVSGEAPSGPDKHAIDFAEKFGVTLKKFPANWSKHGKAAGMIRNKEMRDYLWEKDGYALVIWNGKSRGSANMIKECDKYSIPCKQIIAD